MTAQEHAWHHDTPGGSAAYLIPRLTDALRRFQEQLGVRQPLAIVEFGCGNGHVAALLADMGHDVVGIDSSATAIAIARTRHTAARFELGSFDDGALLGAPRPAADCVIALEVVEHLLYPARLFEAAAGVLRPGGLLLVSTPYHGYAKNLALSLINGWDRHFNVQNDSGHVKFFSNRALATMAGRFEFEDLRFRGAGRMPAVWKSTVMTARKKPGL